MPIGFTFYISMFNSQMTTAAIADKIADEAGYTEGDFIPYAFDVVSGAVDINITDNGDTSNDAIAITGLVLTDKYCPDELCDAGTNDDTTGGLWTENADSPTSNYCIE